jgi:hypothetical protein
MSFGVTCQDRTGCDHEASLSLGTDGEGPFLLCIEHAHAWTTDLVTMWRRKQELMAQGVDAAVAARRARVEGGHG